MVLLSWSANLTGNGQALTQIWSWKLIVISYSLSVLGSLTGVSLMEQRRMSRNLRNKRFLMLMSGAVFGSVTLWGMHVVGMAAMQLTIEDRSMVINIQFDPVLEFLSLFFAIIFAQASLWVASKDRFFGMSKDDRVLMLSDEMKKLSIKKINAGGRHLVIMKALVDEPQHLIAGGLLLATGILLMHYIGMLAMTINATRVWNVGIIIATIIMGAICSIIFIWVLFRLLQWKPHMESLRVLSSFILGGLICAVHYTGMYAATYVTEGDEILKNDGMALSQGVILAVVIWCAISMHLTIYDLRKAILVYQRDVDLLFDQLKASLGHVDGNAAASTGKVDISKIETFVVQAKHVLTKYASVRVSSAASKSTNSRSRSKGDSRSKEHSLQQHQQQSQGQIELTGTSSTSTGGSPEAKAAAAAAAGGGGGSLALPQSGAPGAASPSSVSKRNLLGSFGGSRSSKGSGSSSAKIYIAPPPSEPTKPSPSPPIAASTVPSTAVAAPPAPAEPKAAPAQGDVARKSIVAVSEEGTSNPLVLGAQPGV